MYERKRAQPFSQPLGLGVRKPPTACLLLLFRPFGSWPTSAKPERCVHHPVLIRDAPQTFKQALPLVSSTCVVPIRSLRVPRGPHAPVFLLLPSTLGNIVLFSTLIPTGGAHLCPA